MVIYMDATGLAGLVDKQLFFLKKYIFPFIGYAFEFFYGTNAVPMLTDLFVVALVHHLTYNCNYVVCQDRSAIDDISM